MWVASYNSFVRGNYSQDDHSDAYFLLEWSAHFQASFPHNASVKLHFVAVISNEARDNGSDAVFCGALLVGQ